MMLAGEPAFTPLSSSATLPAPGGDVAEAAVVARTFLARGRTEVRVRHDGGAGGIEGVAAYTDASDRLIMYRLPTASAHFPGRYPRIDRHSTPSAQVGRR